MTAQTRTTLKGYFETGDVPTQAQFADLVDSAMIVSASGGTDLHSTACFQAASPALEITQSGSVIKYNYGTQIGACSFWMAPIPIVADANASNSTASSVYLTRFFLPIRLAVK